MSSKEDLIEAAFNVYRCICISEVTTDDRSDLVKRVYQAISTANVDLNDFAQVLENACEHSIWTENDVEVLKEVFALYEVQFEPVRRKVA